MSNLFLMNGETVFSLRKILNFRRNEMNDNDSWDSLYYGMYVCMCVYSFIKWSFNEIQDVNSSKG